MKSYIINLERSKERLEFIKMQFDKKFLSKYLQSISKRKFIEIHCFTSSEFACNLSKALNLVANGEDAYGAVFEYDIYLSPNAHLFLKDYNWMPKALL